MQKDYTRIVHDDLASLYNVYKKAHPDKETLAKIHWMQVKQPSTEELVQAARRHHMSLADFIDYMKYFKTFYN